jgi:hypothetical protein
MIYCNVELFQDCPFSFAYYQKHHPVLLLVLGCTNQLSLLLKSLIDAIIYAARVREIQSAIWSMHVDLCCYSPWTICRRLRPKSTINFSSYNPVMQQQQTTMITSGGGGCIRTSSTSTSIR